MPHDEGLLSSPAPADAQSTALAEIETLRADPAFESVYQDRHHPGQGAAQAQLTALYETAYPGDYNIVPVTIEALPVDPEASPVEGESQAAAADRVERERVGLRLEEAHGLDWEEKVGGARELLRTAIGDEGFQAVIGAAGNDFETISELICYVEADPSGLLGTIIRGHLEAGVYGDRAALKLAELRTDPQWRDAYDNQRGEAHDLAVARSTALYILKDPPRQIAAALERFK